MKVAANSASWLEMTFTDSASWLEVKFTDSASWLEVTVAADSEIVLRLHGAGTGRCLRETDTGGRCRGAGTGGRCRGAGTGGHCRGAGTGGLESTALAGLSQRRPAGLSQRARMSHERRFWTEDDGGAEKGMGMIVARQAVRTVGETWRASEGSGQRD